VLLLTPVFGVNFTFQLTTRPAIGGELSSCSIASRGQECPRGRLRLLMSKSR